MKARTSLRELSEGFLERWSKLNERLTGVPWYSFWYKNLDRELDWDFLKERSVYLSCKLTWFATFFSIMILGIVVDLILESYGSLPQSILGLWFMLFLVLVWTAMALKISRDTIITIWKNSRIMENSLYLRGK